MPTTSTPLSRRSVLRGAAAVAGLGATGAAASAAQAQDAATAAASGLRVNLRFQLVDRQREQRFLMQSTKPPVYLNGKTYPAEMRQGPPDGSWFIFNDENQSEKGGLTVSSNQAGISFDWPTVDAMHFGSRWIGKQGAAVLTMRQMPDPDIPIEELTPADAPQRVLLGTANDGSGALLFLMDSAGRPRIQLWVDGQDDASIRILDADGNVVAQLPEPQSATAARGGAAAVSPLLQGPAPRLP